MVYSPKAQRLIQSRVGKPLNITFVSGETVRAKIIAAGQTLEEDADFYFIDLDRAPRASFLDTEEEPPRHVYSGVYEEVEDAEVPIDVTDEE